MSYAAPQVLYPLRDKAAIMPSILRRALTSLPLLTAVVLGKPAPDASGKTPLRPMLNFNLPSSANTATPRIVGGVPADVDAAGFTVALAKDTWVSTTYTPCLLEPRNCDGALLN